MAVLTITLTEAVTLGDGSTDRGTTNIQTVTINEVDHRIMDVGTSYIDIIKFAGAAAAGTFKDGVIKYLRITNLDGSANITLRIAQSDAEYFVQITPEDHFILNNNSMDGHEDKSGSSNTVGTAESLANIDAISAKSSSGTIQIEYFIGCQD